MSQEQKKQKKQTQGGKRLNAQPAESREKRSGAIATAVREEEQQMSRRSAAARREAEPADVLTRCTRRVVRWLRRVRLRAGGFGKRRMPDRAQGGEKVGKNPGNQPVFFTKRT